MDDGTASHPRTAPGSVHDIEGCGQRLALRALTPSGRLSVVGREVTLREGRVVQYWTLRHRPALRALLQRHFGFDLPEVLTMRVPSVSAWD